MDVDHTYVAANVNTRAHTRARRLHLLLEYAVEVSDTHRLNNSRLSLLSLLATSSVDLRTQSRDGISHRRRHDTLGFSAAVCCHHYFTCS